MRKQKVNAETKTLSKKVLKLRSEKIAMRIKIQNKDNKYLL